MNASRLEEHEAANIEAHEEFRLGDPHRDPDGSGFVCFVGGSVPFAHTIFSRQCQN